VLRIGRHPSRAAVRDEQLRATGVCVEFVGVRALQDVDLEVARGEILGLIGPNGAGKTTLVNVLSGFQRPTAGDVWLGDRRVTGRSPEQRTRLGLSRTFQSVRLFEQLTVLENVEAAGLAIGLSRRAAADRARELLERFGLGPRGGSRAASLPYGDERRLGLARALAGNPAFLLLDEPAAGLDEQEGDELFDLLQALPAQEGCGIVLIEHDMRLVMRLCHRLQVIDHGQTISVGAPEVVRNDPAVLEAYLGASYTGAEHA
jgi:branched-chain amino acid transport system ATP-binding protein